MDPATRVLYFEREDDVQTTPCPRRWHLPSELRVSLDPESRNSSPVKGARQPQTGGDVGLEVPSMDELSREADEIRDFMHELEDFRDELEVSRQHLKVNKQGWY